ncbi:MAG TPA: hypothetical protein VIO58_10030 [Candidatus Methanoperedens sp.]
MKMNNSCKGQSLSIAFGITALIILLLAGIAGAATPTIEFTYVPPYGSSDNLQGKVTNITPADYKVAVYIYVSGWWTKPTFAQPLTSINADGSWTCTIVTGGSDQYATIIKAYLVPNGYNPPQMSGGQILPSELDSFPNATAIRKPEKHIAFSGEDWIVKSSVIQVGPGLNYFSDSDQSVWVDNQGHLHLKIVNIGGKWYSSEVYSTKSFGHGTYKFYTASRIDQLDKNVVAGLFTWSDAPEYNHREMDIEFSKWGQTVNDNSQYVVQPWDHSGNRYRFNISLTGNDSVHSFNWENNSIAFQSLEGNSVIGSWVYTGSDIPLPGSENVRINLWLYDTNGDSSGDPPSDGKEAELIVKKFEYITIAPGVPAITDFNPITSTVKNNVSDSRTFSITVNQTVNITWFINGTPVQTNNGVTSASYTNTSAALGIWNVTAIASNTNGTDSQMWIWIVAAPSLASNPIITDFKVMPNTSINETNPAVLSANIAKAPDGSLNEVQFGIVDSNNLIGNDRQILAEHRNFSGVEGLYKAEWYAQYHMIANATISDNISVRDEAEFPGYLIAIGSFKTNSTSNEIEDNALLWFNDTTLNLSKVTTRFVYGANPLNIEDGNSTFRALTFKFNESGNITVKYTSDRIFTLYNLTGSSSSNNPHLTRKNVPDGKYTAFVAAYGTNMSATVKTLEIDTIQPSVTPPPPPAVSFSTDKSAYNQGELVTFTITNDGTETIDLPNSAPWRVENAKTVERVFTPIALDVITPLDPGQSMSWTWDQSNDEGKQVPAGTYRGGIRSSIGENFTQEFEILPVSTPTNGSISGFSINTATGKGLPSWTIRLVGIVGTGVETKQIRKEIMTDAEGRWIFDNLPAGRYIIIEQLQKGFIPVSPPVMNLMLAKGQNSTNNNFTNRLISSLIK